MLKVPDEVTQEDEFRHALTVALLIVFVHVDIPCNCNNNEGMIELNYCSYMHLKRIEGIYRSIISTKSLMDSTCMHALNVLTVYIFTCMCSSVMENM